MDRKIIGMGETILDILFKNNQPMAAVPGGSSFNSIISVGRAHVPCCFIGYTGADVVGQQTIQFMQDNGVQTDYFQVREEEKSAVSLAFLNEQGDANYVFYKPPFHDSQAWSIPTFCANDVVLYGSYYAACTSMRSLVSEVLSRAGEAQSIIYYDLNFRKSHAHELEALMPTIQSNFGRSTIVRGSADDFDVMFGLRDARQIYRQHISPFCPLFICTAGAGQITVCTPSGCYDYQAPQLDNVVSTVGAGDSFNAGFACALVWEGVTLESLATLAPSAWGRLISIACQFAGNACQSTQNYIGPQFVDEVLKL